MGLNGLVKRFERMRCTRRIAIIDILGRTRNCVDLGVKRVFDSLSQIQVFYYRLQITETVGYTLVNNVEDEC